MIVKPLIFELVRENDKYFPGEKGSRAQVEINLNKFIYKKNLNKRKKDISSDKNVLIKID
tara:strand:+ start:194 stop:373 length:180 start_codon:yes stop_codon:yes gene_type:complete